MRIRDLLILLLAEIFFVGCGGQNTQTPEQRLAQQIQKSHVEGNVPDAAQFEAFIQRDLEAHFSGIYEKEVEVRWEFLREGATQSGVATPKFYLWTILYADGNKLDEGAVRVAAVGQTGLKVTNFISLSEIKKSEQDIYSVFPAPVCEKIKDKIR